MGDLPDDPPKLSVRIPQRRALPKKAHAFSEDFVIDFLLLTVVDIEFLSCVLYLQERLKFYDKKTGFVYVGKMGDETEQEKLTIGLMQCGMGSGVGGSTVTVQNAVTTLKPKGVFCVGFCGGMNVKKAKLGDVVVSAKLNSYALRKVTEDGIVSRGTIVPLSKKLNAIMKHAADGWEPPLENMEEAEPRVVPGTMLSGPMLVNSKNERDRLLKYYPDAIAIEMEGEGKIPTIKVTSLINDMTVPCLHKFSNSPVLLFLLLLLLLLERFSFECRKVISFARSKPHDWLKRFAPLFHPIRSKTKTNRDALACIFPRFASATCNYFEF